MRQFRRNAVLMLLVASFFMTGCDAQQILDVISKIATGVQQAMPAIKNVVDAFGQVANNVNNAPADNPAAANNNNEQAAANNANVVTIDPNAENVGNANTTGAAGTAGVGAVQALERPDGRAGIERVFGARGTNQVTVTMAAGPNGSARSITCHRLIAPRLKAVFDEIKAQGLSNLINTNDGCFNNRNKRGGTSPSTHAWGIAIDINASQNPMGSSRMTSGQRQLAAIFQRYGFYQLPNDPMHFQYCTGY
ncbi:MAG: hypothetical protein CVV41_17885 [Candidatus Riflebacteria bacterium HGW-Riflebacteria-1]|jgi:hypothetical protein|nr:MAG: hypothetical protein CVV41_17885 [Candidatus Riflebacteria bacterium HGW-Riflebacteria-1]